MVGWKRKDLGWPWNTAAHVRDWPDGAFALIFSKSSGVRGWIVRYQCSGDSEDFWRGDARTVAEAKKMAEELHRKDVAACKKIRW